MGNSTWNAGKKSTTTIKNDKTKVERWNRKKKAAQKVKQTVQLKEISQKVLAKEVSLKRDRIKPYRQNKTFQNNEKVLSTSKGGMHGDKPATEWQENKTILERKMVTKRT